MNEALPAPEEWDSLALRVLAEKVRTDMDGRRDAWIHGHEDEPCDAFLAAFDRVLPEDKIVNFVALFAADVCATPSPGCIGDTLGVVIRDAVRDAVEYLVGPWYREEWEAHDASACANEALSGAPNGRSDG